MLQTCSTVNLYLFSIYMYLTTPTEVDHAWVQHAWSTTYYHHRYSYLMHYIYTPTYEESYTFFMHCQEKYVSAVSTGELYNKWKIQIGCASISRQLMLFTSYNGILIVICIFSLSALSTIENYKIKLYDSILNKLSVRNLNILSG